MKRQPVAARMAGVLAVLAPLVMTGCNDSKSVVHVEVTGTVEGLFQLVVDVSAGGLATTLHVPSPPRPITLPTTFNLEMDRSRTGSLGLNIKGNDEAGYQIASGSGELADIDVGHRQDMSIELTALSPPGG